MEKKKGSFFASPRKTSNTVVGRIFDAIRVWYDGTPEQIGGPFIGVFYRQHWTAKAAHALVAFWLKHWKWLIGSGAAFIAWVLTFKP
jgi:hypothetical protein